VLEKTLREQRFDRPETRCGIANDFNVVIRWQIHRAHTLTEREALFNPKGKENRRPEL
jgi:hypothetical protein